MCLVEEKKQYSEHLKRYEKKEIDDKFAFALPRAKVDILIQPVHPKGNQSWKFIGRTDAEAETPILCPLDVKNWLSGKDDAGKNWRQEEKGMTEDDMVGWHYWLSGHEFEQALGVGDGQESLACCSPWGHKESDKTELLKWTELNFNFIMKSLLEDSPTPWKMTN